MFFILAAAAAAACIGNPGAAEPQARRVMPPPTIECERNRLTSYAGVVRDYQRTERRVSLLIDTDWGTTEAVVIELAAGEAWADRMLTDGGAYAGFDSVETGDGRLKPGQRAVAWVCEDPAVATVIDWRTQARAE